MKKAIEIKHLSYEYPDGSPALEDVGLIISQGEKAALIGPNGAGKSTLLLHLNGILSGNGSIRIQGVEVEKNNLALVRTMVGLVFQSPDDQLFSPTVYQDVAYGPIYQGLTPEEVQTRVAQALNSVGMSSCADRVSYHLSQGEKKRIAVATVLSMEPDILALDEPTAGLDPRSRRELIQLLRSLPQTMLIATHDLAMAESLTKRTVILDNGRIAADGDTYQLLSDQNILECYGLK